MSHKLQHIQAKIKIILDLGTSPLPLLKLKKCCTVIGVHCQESASRYVHQQNCAKWHSKKTCWDVSICPHILHCSSLGQFLFTNCSADGRQSEYKDHRKNLIFNGILALHMLMISLFSSPVKVSSLYNDAVVKLPFLSSA
jgi:hypothetical protein